MNETFANMAFELDSISDAGISQTVRQIVEQADSTPSLKWKWSQKLSQWSAIMCFKNKNSLESILWVLMEWVLTQKSTDSLSHLYKNK